MKVLDLRCAQDHRFEGWFASEEDAQSQISRDLVQCPVCGDHAVSRLPSAPRLNLSGATAKPAQTQVRGEEGKADAQQMMQALQAHYLKPCGRCWRRPRTWRAFRRGSAAHALRGGARTRHSRFGNAEDVQALADEGIDAFPLIVPDALKQTAH
jgi:hypothetical protein